MQASAARMLGVSVKALLADTQLLGLLFENACLWGLCVYLSAGEDFQDGEVCYYGYDAGFEVDSVIQMPDGR